MPLPEQGTALLSALLYEPGLIDRPLVMVGHSLGGLVIKSGIVNAETLGDPRFQPILRSLAAVVFVGTPHQGSSWATVASRLSRLLRTNPQVVNMMANDVWLKNLNGQFLAIQAKRGFRVAVFFETTGIFFGWKVLGMSIGPRVLIVDRNSSDPNVPNVTPIPVEGDHVQIAKPSGRQAAIHKALVGLLGEVRSPPAPTHALDARAVARALYKASAPLLTWPTTLLGGVWLERPELQNILQSLSDTESSTTLLLGEPGSGKSALLARVAERKHADGWPVLAIKADRLPPDILDTEGLAKHLQLPTTAVDAVHSLASFGPVLVLIDQMDALAELVVQHPRRLRVLLDLIRDLSDTARVHIVASCRTFEQRHDPSLRAIEASVLTLELPQWPTVQAALARHSVPTESWNDDLKEALRSPHALDLFLELLGSVSELAVLASFHGMLERQWQAHVLSDKSGRRKEAVLAIARTMADREVLGLPLSVVESWFEEIKQLAATGLLRFDEAAARVEFRHQTLYEFVRARSFLEEMGSLTEAVLHNQASLRVRPLLWHALAYFRTSSPEGYAVELERLWASGIRRHLRSLLIEFLGQQIAPLAVEKHLVYRSLDDAWFRPRFIASATGSPGWLQALAANHLPMWMAQPVDEARQLVPLLDAALSVDLPLVTNLVKQVWLCDVSKDELSWRVLAMGSVAPQTPEWVTDLEVVVARSSLADWAVAHAVSVVSASLPDEAPRLVAAWLRRRFAQLTAGSVATGTADDDVDKPARAGLRNLHELAEFHELSGIAQAAPKAFVRAVWPIYVEMVAHGADDEHAFVTGYRRSAGLVFDDTEREGSRESLLQVMSGAVQEWAQTEPIAFVDFTEMNSGSDLLVVQCLLAKGLRKAAASSPTRVLAYLLADSRRMVLGPASDVHKETVALIQELGPHLSDTQLAELEAYVRDWRYYKASPDGDDAATRHRRIGYYRQHRLRLLRALPVSRCSADTRRLIEEEERAFPGLRSGDFWFTGVTAIGSPVTADQMARSADRDILGLFAEIQDEHAWDHPRDRMKGGAIQAGRELGALAKKDLSKVLRIVSELQPGTNEIPVATVLRELVPAGLAAADLFALVERLDQRGFKSGDFRRDAAYAVSAAISATTPAPDSLVSLMENWLEPYEGSESEDQDAKDEHRDVQSILWDGGRFRTLPNGNYPILEALSCACLQVEPIQTDRWLGILERHLDRAESMDIWCAMLRHNLRQLRLADKTRAEAFLDRLVDSYPALAATDAWVLLVAHAYHWASESKVQAWIDGIPLDQGVGELAALRAALFPTESWPSELVRAALAAGDDAADRRVGIAYAVAHLWGAPATRRIVQPYLLALIATKEDRILRALSGIFMHGIFLPDQETRQFLDALVENNSLLSQPQAERFTEVLERLVSCEPDRVYRVANVMLDIAGEQMGNIATSWYLSTDALIGVSLLLQDLGASHRDAGSALFERMLELNMPQAREMSLDLDRRTPMQATRRPQRRRRVAKRPANQRKASS